jgi:hypothetical protein
MDWSDEKVKTLSGWWCGSSASTFECDEHICSHRTLWPCGDGECVRWSQRFPFQKLVPEDRDCYNLRNLYFMCEVSTTQILWTQMNNMCTNNLSYDGGEHNMVIDSDESQIEICIYLIRCSLSENSHCPCNELNCSLLMNDYCDDRPYMYPVGPLIRPYFYTFYYWQNISPTPNLFLIHGSIKCRGYQGSASVEEIDFRLNLNIVRFNRLDYLLCLTTDANFSSPFQYDETCWNNSVTFNGQQYGFYDACPNTKECISQYRISDAIVDCPYADDEFGQIKQDLCVNIHEYRFRCSEDQYSCLTAQALGDQNNFCDNYFDEHLYGSGVFLGSILCENKNTDNCGFLKDYMRMRLNTSIFNTTTSSRIRFRAYCNGEWDLGDRSDESSIFCPLWTCRQDEYRCKTGQCIDLSWVCDGIWDCSDASDEEALSVNQPWSFHNQKLGNQLTERKKQCDERYKVQPFANVCDLSQQYPCYLNNVTNPLDIVTNLPCIPFSKIGDGYMDCHQALDEKNTFEKAKGSMKGFSLQCDDDDGAYVQYPYACRTDTCFDSILCSYKSQNITYCSEPNDVVCLNGSCVQNARCNAKSDCPFGEDEHWCQPKGNPISLSFYRNLKKWVPTQEQFVNWSLLSPAPSDIETYSHRSSSQHSTLYAISFKCNRGIAVFEQEKIRCFCPPAYYGDKCQYYSDRLSIVLRIDWNTFSSLNLTGKEFTLKALFLFNNERIIDRYEIHLNPVLDTKKHKFYLLYSRSKDMLRHKKTRYFNRTDVEHVHPYSLRFELYSLEHDNSILELGSWYYPILFDFLPSHRLAKVLKLPTWFGNKTFDPCASIKNADCPQNSECKPILNSNNSFYCSCRYGFYGTRCNQYLSICESYCSHDSICKPEHYNNHTKPFCVCPLSYFGPSCHLRYDACDSLPCGMHGTCHLTYDYSGERPYQCVCNKDYYMERCQLEKIPIRIELNMTNSQIQASVVQLYDVHMGSLDLLLRHQQVYFGIPSIIQYHHGQTSAPPLAVLKTHEHYDTISNYYLVYIRPIISVINISATPEHCLHSSTFINGNGSVFLYHEICQNGSVCFYDRDYLCICESNHYRAECFGHDLQLDHCDLCLSNGKCVKGDLNDAKNFMCLCPYCYQGRLCEFSFEGLGFTLDSLLFPDSITVQVVYIILAFLFAVIGFFTNFCSLVTFKRPQVRKYAVGTYLLLISIVNQCAMFCLCVKFVHIFLGSFGLINNISCKSVSYLLSVLTRSSFWLTAWVSFNRLCLILIPMSLRLKNSRLAIYSSIVTLFLLFLTHIHEIFVYTTIQQPDRTALQCVTNFKQTSVAIYNRVFCLFHSLVPFFIQVIAITLIIVLVTRNRARTNNIGDRKRSFIHVLKRQMSKQKELFITPIIIVLSSLPQIILSFTVACTQLSDLKRHSLLAASLLSYGPQIFGFVLFVLPSTNYKKEFSQTSIGHKLLS